jgi:hypothetical protein
MGKLYLNEEEYGGGGGGVDYSTTEQDTGKKWIDGRPVYQRTFYIASLNNGSNTIVDSSFSLTTHDVMYVTFVQWVYTYNNADYLVCNNVGGSGSNGRFRVNIIPGSGLQGANLNSGFTMKDIYFTVQYTKVADLPQS